MTHAPGGWHATRRLFERFVTAFPMPGGLAATTWVLACAVASASAQVATTSPFDGTRLQPIQTVYVTHVPATDSSQPERTLSTRHSLEEADVDGRAAWKLIEEGIAGNDFHSVDIWDRTTLEAIRRTITYQGTTTTLDHQQRGVRVSTADGVTETFGESFAYPVVSDGMLNYYALGTLPLKLGYTSYYNSLVRREGAILTHRLDVVGEKTIDVPAGRFDTYVVTEHLTDASATPIDATWYVMKETPRLVARLEASLPNGTVVTVSLQQVHTQ
jgi:hypothetical protein